MSDESATDAQGFYARFGEGDGSVAHVKGNPDMSEKTLGALRAVFQAAYDAAQRGELEELNEAKTVQQTMVCHECGAEATYVYTEIPRAGELELMFCCVDCYEEVRGSSNAVTDYPALSEEERFEAYYQRCVAQLEALGAAVPAKRWWRERWEAHREDEGAG